MPGIHMMKKKRIEGEFKMFQQVSTMIMGEKTLVCFAYLRREFMTLDHMISCWSNLGLLQHRLNHHSIFLPLFSADWVVGDHVIWRHEFYPKAEETNNSFFAHDHSCYVFETFYILLQFFCFNICISCIV